MKDTTANKNSSRINALSMRINVVYDTFNDEIRVLNNKVKAIESNLVFLSQEISKLKLEGVDKQ